MEHADHIDIVRAEGFLLGLLSGLLHPVPDKRDNSLFQRLKRFITRALRRSHDAQNERNEAQGTRKEIEVQRMLKNTKTCPEKHQLGNIDGTIPFNIAQISAEYFEEFEKDLVRTFILIGPALG